MPFSLLTNTVSLAKANGQRIDGIKASVQKNKIFIMDKSVLIESGDLIEHRMSNGAVENYEVLDPGFCEAFSGVSAHYQIEVRKRGVPDLRFPKSPVQNIISIGTMIGSQIQQNTHDSVQITSRGEDFQGDLKKLIDQLRSLSADHIRDPMAHKDFSCDLQTIEAQLQSSKPKISFIKESLHSLRSIAENIGAGVVVELIKNFLVAHHLL